MEIKGSVAVVTGGVSGLGEATARRLHGEGAKVVLLDVNAEKGEAVAGELGDGAVFVQTDITETEQVEATMKRAVDEFGGLHILVNCAGVSWSRRTLNKEGPYPLEYWTKIIDINLVGTFDCIRNAVVHMALNEANEDGERGVIVNTGSAAASEGQIGQSAYTASKAGVVGMTLPLARDLAVIGVRVCTINPGTFATPMVAPAPQEFVDALISQNVFPRRTGKPEEYASLAREIITNPMLNAETIRLDAGVRMAPT
jgi:3-hydroxyacyl-CoA dehydrogenase/3-hydroxy-2-methylbutyryl-CoA dehydrogenase